MQVVIWADPISPDGTPEDTLDACLQTIDDFDRKVLSILDIELRKDIPSARPDTVEADKRPMRYGP
jgi:hypothetical protein